MYDSRYFALLSTPGAHASGLAGSGPMTRFVEELIAAWNDHDPSRVAACYAPDYQGRDVAQTGMQIGSRDIRRTTAYYLRAFPDLVLSADEVVVQGSRVVIAWTWRGTHRGTFMRIPPTGREVTVSGVSLMIVDDGLIRRGIRMWDLAGLLRALGLLPDL